MSHSPKVALVYPYFQTDSPARMLFPPLGIASLASQLKASGLNAQIFDCTFRDFDRVVDELVASSPEIIGIYSMVSISRNALRIAEQLRQRLPDKLLVAGGPLPTLYPQQYLQHFDLVFKGEADLAFPRFCRDYLLQGKTPRNFQDLPLSTYDGISYNLNGTPEHIATQNYPETIIQALPIPDRQPFDHAAYQQFWLQRDATKTTSLITTLGCPYECDFCSKPVFGKLFRRRNLDTIFAEVEQIQSLGYDTLWIADDNFTLDPAYLRGFCERMRGRGLRWSCLSRVSGITPQTASMMSAAGCRRVYLGLESGCQETLTLMNKRATLHEGENAIRVFKGAGVGVAGFFIVGYPGESVASMEKTFAFALHQPFDEISFNVPYPLPGSGLFEKVTGLESEKDWQEENEVSFLFQTEFDQQWIRQRIRETLADFSARSKT